MKKEKRKTKIINKRFQFKYLFQILTLELFFVIITIIFTIVFNILLLNSPYLVSNYWLWISIYSFLIFAVGALLLIKKGIDFSHRIAGPIYKLRKAMEKLLMGNTEQKVRFRKNDEWHEIAILFNKIVGKINADLGLYQEKLIEILKTIEEIEKNIESIPESENKRKIKKMINDLKTKCLLDEKNKEIKL